MTKMPRTMAAEDLEVLEWATRHLEHPSLAARLSSIVGTPIDIAINLLPRRVYKRLRATADASIYKVLRVALSSLRHDQEPDPHNRMYRVLTAGTGAIGGYFGLFALPLELPVTTTLILRSVAEIARTEGEDVHDSETQAACLEVFALGGQSESDDAAETGYYGVRLALGLAVTRASRYAVAHGFSADGPALVRLVSFVAPRFGLALTEKAAAQWVPMVGAAGGAAINLIFLTHFQDMARGHFVVRRLERKYGPKLVKAHYEQFAGAG